MGYYVNPAGPVPIDPLTILYIMEAPYALYGDKVVLLAMAGRETGQETGFRILMSIGRSGSSYLPIGRSSMFNQHGVLAVAYPETASQIDEDVGITIDFDDFGLSAIETITRDGLMGLQNMGLLVRSYTSLAGVKGFKEELISFETVTPITTTRLKLEGVYRGRFDTEIQAWPVGSHFLYLGSTQYTKIESRDFVVNNQRFFKFVPHSNSLGSQVDEALPYIHTISGRAFRPLPPTNFAGNGSSKCGMYDDAGDVVLTWKGRTRAAGAGMQERQSVPVAQAWEGTFTIYVYDYWSPSQPGHLKDTITGVNALTYTYDAAAITAAFGSHPAAMAFVLENTRTGTDGHTYTSEKVSITMEKRI